MTAPLDDEQLEAIRQRVDAATPGPWMAANEHGNLPPESSPAWCVCQMRPGYENMEGQVDDRGRRDGWLRDVAETPGRKHEYDHDAEFIAHAREDVPALLREVDRLRAMFDGMTDEWGIRDVDGWVSRHRSRATAERESIVPGDRVVHRRVPEWQEVQP